MIFEKQHMQFDLRKLRLIRIYSLRWQNFEKSPTQVESRRTHYFELSCVEVSGHFEEESLRAVVRLHVHALPVEVLATATYAYQTSKRFCMNKRYNFLCVLECVLVG